MSISDKTRLTLDGRLHGDVGVLVVDDDLGDALLVQEALESLGVARRLVRVVSNGDEALVNARAAGKSADDAGVRLILLDLNLAGHQHGLEVLKALKTDAELLTIPVVVLSSSRHPADIAGSYALHANAYVVKPVSLDDWNAMIASVHSMFLRHAEPAPDAETFSAADHPVLGAHSEHSHGLMPDPADIPSAGG
jgi:CheY-like chemotaxis protein